MQTKTEIHTHTQKKQKAQKDDWQNLFQIIHK